MTAAMQWNAHLGTALPGLEMGKPQAGRHVDLAPGQPGGKSAWPGLSAAALLEALLTCACRADARETNRQ